MTNIDFAALIRTYVPYAIGLALAWLFVHIGFDLRGGPAEVALVAFTTAVAMNGYYALVRVIELRWPILGILLGLPKSPTYARVDDLWASLVRTSIPVVAAFALVTAAGYIAAWSGFVLEPGAIAQLTSLTVAVLSALYYSLARLILERFPSAYWLLGTGETPIQYVAKHAAT